MTNPDEWVAGYPGDAGRWRRVCNVTEGQGFGEGAVLGRWAKATRMGGTEASEGRVF